MGQENQVFWIFFSGILVGFLLALFFIVMIFRWAARNQELLRAIIKEIYHIDLLPFIARIEGLINLAIMEYRLHSYQTLDCLERSLAEVRKLKDSIIASVKKYEKYQ